VSGYPQVVGRYVLFEPIASGGMGMIHLGRLHGPLGFSRTVAIKRLHPACAGNAQLVVMLSDEARLAARVEHPNVVRTLDVVTTEGELLVVLEFVHGVSLARIWQQEPDGERLPIRVVLSIMIGALYGLHAAHEAASEGGAPLGIVHRDVSPQNILVGSDGIARVLDFGVAKALGRLHTTRDGSIKGKMAYMPVEQLSAQEVDRRADIYAASVVLWEMLTGRRLFSRDSEAATVTAVLTEKVAPPSEHAPDLPKELDAITLRGLDRDRSKRFATALDMAAALEELSLAASPREVAEYLRSVAAEPLKALSGAVRAVEAMSVEGEQTACTPNPIRQPQSGAMGEMTDTQSALSTSESGSSKSVSAVFPPVAPPRRKRGAVLGVTSVTVLAIALLGAAAFRNREQPQAGGKPAPPPPVVASAEERAIIASSARVPLADPPSVPPPQQPSVAPSRSAQPVRRHGSSHASAAASSAPPVAAAPTESTKSNCNPPYIVDEAGVRRVKRECIE
jgi:serine/threonine-protein kinase